MIVTQSNGEIVYVTSKLSPEDIKMQMEHRPKQKYPHLCNLKLWVKDCEESNNPYVRWEFKDVNGSNWRTCDVDTPMFLPKWEYRRSQIECTVNGYKVPLGLSLEGFQSLIENDSSRILHYPDLHSSSLHTCATALNILKDLDVKFLIQHRLLYVNKDDAIKRVSAMLKWDIVP